MDKLETTSSVHQLPELAYTYSALEPHIDAETMRLHHGKHHAGYVATLNSILAKFPDLQKQTALWLLLNLDKVPGRIRTAIRNNAGGHVNHTLFWELMSPTTSSLPSGTLVDALTDNFGSLDKFKQKFELAGNKVFGSGWVWLARAQRDGGRLQIYTTSAHNNPLMQGHYPIMLNDVWEHAYYLKYQNRRADYLKSWWSIVNWDEATARFERSDASAVQDWEDEGGQTAVV